MNYLTKKISAIAVILLLVMYGCTTTSLEETQKKEEEKEKEKENPPAGTAKVKYDPDIKGIMEANCTGCHGGSSPRAGLSLTSFANVKSKASAIKNRTNNVNNPMPPGGLMAQEKRDKITAWIKAGFPEK